MPLKNPTHTQQRAAKRDAELTKAIGKGWQLIKGVALQADTERLLKASARRLKLDIRVTLWADGTSVTYKVERKAVKNANNNGQTTAPEVEFSDATAE